MRRRLTIEERVELAKEAHDLSPDKKFFVQEWTNPDGKPIIVTILER